ncbi:SUN domain-containing protein 3 [Clydaea vesicula]|uniref:SUN domain-containing protein 3 n=1 Tax=Clydaea vesicula TaxID=447962 RepID=A0AAD5XUU0_9FUNG|nr:SUN domain-containing protein 3 [Clydaea vesicula]
MTTELKQRLERTRILGTPCSTTSIRIGDAINGARTPLRSSLRLREKREACSPLQERNSNKKTEHTFSLKSDLQPRKFTFVKDADYEAEKVVETKYNYVCNENVATPRAVAYLKHVKAKVSDFFSPQNIKCVEYLQNHRNGLDDSFVVEDDEVEEGSLLYYGREPMEVEPETFDYNEDDYNAVSWFQHFEHNSVSLSNSSLYKTLEQAAPVLKMYEEQVKSVSSKYENIKSKIISLQETFPKRNTYNADFDVDPKLIESINGEIQKLYDANNAQLNTVKDTIHAEKENINNILIKLKEFDSMINSPSREVSRLKKELEELIKASNLRNIAISKEMGVRFAEITHRYNEVAENFKLSEYKDEQLSKYRSHMENENELKAIINELIEKKVSLFIKKPVDGINEEVEKEKKSEFLEDMIEKKLEKALNRLPITGVMHEIVNLKQDFTERLNTFVKDQIYSKSLEMKDDFVKDLHDIKQSFAIRQQRLESDEKKSRESINRIIKEAILGLNNDINLHKSEVAALRNRFVDMQLEMEKSFENVAEESISDFLRVHHIQQETQFGSPDYALGSGGAAVLECLTSTTYCAKKTFFGCDATQNPPNTIIDKDVSLGKCWPMSGNNGHVGISLSRSITPTSITIEHVAKELNFYNNYKSAPKNFKVYAVFTKRPKTQLIEFTKERINGKDFYLAPLITSPESYYDVNKISDGSESVYGRSEIQTFRVENKVEGVRNVIVKVESNWGNENYTCLYRVRVHGQEDEELYKF